MAVDIELLPANSINNIDTNFERVETALQDVVGRSGDTPNQMNTDLDLNDNDLLNVNRIDASEYYMDGGPLVSNPNFEAVLAIADEIQVVADNADNVVIVADNIADILAAEGYANAAAASATEADGYADDAGISAAAASVSETNAGISETNSEASAIAAEGFAQDAEDAAIGLTLSAVPVGMVFFSPKGTVPAGYLALEGGSFDELVYTELYDYLGTNVLPDYTDRVLRHAGPLAGAVFTTQEDALQGHGHDLHGYGPNGNLNGLADGHSLAGSLSGTVTRSDGELNRTYVDGSVAAPADDGVNGTPRIAEETRVKAAIGKFVIKAYAALVDGGTADLVAIEAAQQYMVRFDAQVLTALQQQQAMLNLGVPITKYYESAPQSITLGGLLTFTHGFGVRPKDVKLQVVCTTADSGYAIGDTLWISELGSGDGGTSAAALGFTVYEDAADATTIKVRNPAGSGGAFLVAGVKSTGNRAVLDAADWNLIVRAWA